MVIALLTSCEESDKYTVVIDKDDLLCYVEYTADSKILNISDDFDANITVHRWCKGVGRIYFNKPITKIDDFAFYNCYNLTSITIPDSVTSIGIWAFSDCDSLTTVKIGNSVTSIGSYAFYNSDRLTSITIPDIVTSIGDYAFAICDSLTSVTIPDSVTSIGEGAFYNCESLTSVYCVAITPPALGYDVFNKNASGRKIYVPRNSVDVYKNADGWRTYSSYILGYDFE